MSAPADRNHYSAQRDPRTGRWRGWMTYASAPTAIVWDGSGQSYRTKAQAVAAVKAQHPESIDDVPEKPYPYPIPRY